MPDYVFYYRFRDGTASWGGDKENTRFQQSNICDCMMFDGHKLYLLELKSHKGKSLPFSAIRQNQIDELAKSLTYQGVTSGFVVNFSDVARTFFADANLVANYVFIGERKSIPLAWFEEHGKEIQGKLKKVHYSWNVEKFLTEVKQDGN